MRLLALAALLGLASIAATHSAFADPSCRDVKPWVSIEQDLPGIPPKKPAARLTWEYKEPPTCWNTVHLRFGIIGQKPTIVREVRTKGCGGYVDGRPQPHCAYGTAYLVPNTRYEVNAQECDKHAFSADQCSAWAHMEFTSGKY